MGASKSSASSYVYKLGLVEHIERPNIKPLIEWYKMERDGFSSEEWLSVDFKDNLTAEEIDGILECEEWYCGDLQKCYFLDPKLTAKVHRLIPASISKNPKKVKERLNSTFTKEELKTFAMRALAKEVREKLQKIKGDLND